MKNPPELGLDMDQEFFVAWLSHDGGRHRHKFDNTEAGFAKLSAWLKRIGVTQTLACMEATGRYGNKLAEYLFALGHEVAVINPAFISSHKGTMNKHNKTDAIDAEAIADYARCFRHKIRLWQPKSPAHQALIDVVGQIQLVKKTRTAYSNRSQSGIETQAVQDSIRKMIEFLDNELEQLEEEKQRLLDQLPRINEVHEIVDSVPGIGPVGADLLASRVDFSNFSNGRVMAAFLGAGSKEWQSGKQKRRGKLTKAGDSQIRATLRMGAVSAINHGFYHDFVERLRKRGLKDKQIITAVVRKMLLIAHSLVRKKQLFDCCYLNPLSSRAA